MKQKFNRNNGDHIIRQSSLEMYSRENHTFRGYSFLYGSDPNIVEINKFDPDAFLFCLPESKDHSFTAFGTPIHELEL